MTANISVICSLCVVTRTDNINDSCFNLQTGTVSLFHPLKAALEQSQPVFPNAFLRQKSSASLNNGGALWVPWHLLILQPSFVEVVDSHLAYNIADRSLGCDVIEYSYWFLECRKLVSHRKGFILLIIHSKHLYPTLNSHPCSWDGCQI